MQHRTPTPSLLASVLLLSLLGGCTTMTAPGHADAPATKDAIRDVLAEARAVSAPVAPPPLPAPEETVAVPVALTQALPKKELRFSMTFMSVAPELLFLTILRESPFSVAVDPSLKAPMAISLKDVTVREALEILRELHGFDYQLVGRQLVVRPAEMQTRMYRVSYPVFSRNGRSETRVVSGSITGGNGNGSGGNGNVNGAANSSNNGSTPPQQQGGSSAGAESSRVSTSQRNDVWSEIEQSVRLIVGDAEGSSVVISPQTGTIIVRGMPREQRSVAQYLESARLSIERQVMIEAKIVDVQLRESVSTGINWSAFRTGGSRGSVGVLNPGTNLAVQGAVGSASLSANVPGQDISAAANLPGGLLGLVFQASNFAAVLEFLGTQGNVQVLSSPRIATMNNQKAVLKVGTDDFFVTNISTTTTSTGNTSQTSPTISVQPFFSGIALDVTPHIDDQGFIVLHIHPAVSNVGERNKVLNLGSLGNFTLPLASSDVSETDSVVRAHDGKIIAIGGLMRSETGSGSSGLPGVSNSFLRTALGGKTDSIINKRELVILLKPTIIDPAAPDPSLTGDALARIDDLMRKPVDVAAH